LYGLAVYIILAQKQSRFASSSDTEEFMATNFKQMMEADAPGIDANLFICPVADKDAMDGF
jgi:hypothetical protein